MKFAVAALSLCGALAAGSAQAATAQDRAFVAKVGQGGMFEIEAGKLAENRAAAVDIRDFATMEVHDHTGVGDRLKAVSARRSTPRTWRRWLCCTMATVRPSPRRPKRAGVRATARSGVRRT